MVLVGHSFPPGQSQSFAWKVLGNGDLGVSIFFVISGFLITSLLLREHEKTGQISVRQFYVRRAYRILPPFFVFMLTLFILRETGMLELNFNAWASAVFFLRDYWRSGDWWTAHTWSLSIEEQFYLLWPACLVMAGIAKSKKIAIALIIAGPVIRVVCHLLFPHVGWQEQLMFHMRMDGLMIGAAVALFADKLELDWRFAAPAALFLFVLSPYLTTRLHGYYLLAFGYSLDNLAIAYLLLYAVRNSKSLIGRFLNNRAVAHIGVISYSLYLWQELFLGKWRGPLGILGALVAAELSWRIVERPALRIRDAHRQRSEALAVHNSI